MFSTIVAVCFAMEIGGEPKNPCWMTRGEERFMTATECYEYARRKEVEMRAELGQQYDVAAVVSIACGKGDF